MTSTAAIRAEKKAMRKRESSLKRAAREHDEQKRRRQEALLEATVVRTVLNTTHCYNLLNIEIRPYLIQ